MHFHDKSEARKWAKKTLAGIDISRLASESEAATVHLEGTAAFEAADIVLAYLPMKAEADARFLIEAARSRGKAIAVPRIVSDTEIEFARIDALSVDLDGLPKDRYFIGVPPAEALAIPLAELARRRVLCAVPGLLFSRNRMRLGRGKGYYDRFLSSMRALSPLTEEDRALIAGEYRGQESFFIAAGFALSEQLVDAIPVDAHDAPMELVVTGEGVLNT